MAALRYPFCRDTIPDTGRLISTVPTNFEGKQCDETCADCLTWLASSDGFDKTQQIRSLALNYLFTDARSQDGDIDLCQPNDRRGWWATSCRSDGFELGSRLWLLQSSRLDNDTVLRAREYAEEALGKLVSQGIIEKVVVNSEICGCNEIKLEIELYVNGGPVEASVVGELNPGFGYLWSELNG